MASIFREQDVSVSASFTVQPAPATALIGSAIQTSSLQAPVECYQATTNPREGPGTPKKHKCDFCNRWFSCPHNVNQHIKEKHTHEKPYVCDLCVGRFTAGGKPRGQFSRPFGLYRHQREVHGMQVETNRRKSNGKRALDPSEDDVGANATQPSNMSARINEMQDVHQAGHDSNDFTTTLAAESLNLPQLQNSPYRPLLRAPITAQPTNTAMHPGPVSNPQGYMLQHMANDPAYNVTAAPTTTSDAHLNNTTPHTAGSNQTNQHEITEDAVMSNSAWDVLATLDANEALPDFSEFINFDMEQGVFRESDSDANMINGVGSWIDDGALDDEGGDSRL